MRRPGRALGASVPSGPDDGRPTGYSSSPGSPMRVSPAGSTTTTRWTSPRRSTRPIAFSASPGSMEREILGRGLAQRRSSPVAVPSSSTGPSAVDLRHQAADPNHPPDMTREIHEVDVARPGHLARRASAAAAAPADPPVGRVHVAVGGPRATSAVERGTIANRRSLADGYGRRTIPTTVAGRPSTSAVAGIAAPASPLTTTRSRPTASSARQRAPSRTHVHDRAADPDQAPLVSRAGGAAERPRQSAADHGR